MAIHQIQRPSLPSQRRLPVIGLAGVMYAIATPEAQASSFGALLPVINHLDRHYTEEVSMKEMAEMAALSTTHFNAQFREILRMSPTE